VRSLFAENKVRFALAEQLWATVKYLKTLRNTCIGSGGLIKHHRLVLTEMNTRATDIAE